MTSKKGLLVFFCTRWALSFEIKQRWAPFFPGISKILPRFLTDQNVWGCACTPASYTTTYKLKYARIRFVRNVIKNFLGGMAPLALPGNAHEVL